MRQRVHSIYKIETPCNGRCYVGSAVNVFNRYSAHIGALIRGKHPNIHLQRAWDKYGPAEFQFSLLEIVENPGDLLAREQHWLNALDCYRVGYNRRPEAQSNSGHRHSAETRARMSAAHIGRPKGEMSVEHRLALAEALRGRTLSEEHRAKVSAAGRQRVQSDETRQKVALAVEAAWADPEHRAFRLTRIPRALTRGQILRMLDDHAGGESKRALAEKYGITRRMVSNIVRGVNYADIYAEWSGQAKAA